MIAAMRRGLRATLPPSVRLRIALAKRGLSDKVSGVADRIVAAPAAPVDLGRFRQVARVVQPIRRTEHSEGKLHNLMIAARLLNGIVLPPDGVFSFWALVGPPVPERGFRTGRSIRQDRLGADVGGGLCQISGLAYELGLRGGMAIVERHAHTQDLYTEETRFTPLGLDATVVWGHKDLRLRNRAGHRLALAFDVADGEIRGGILADRPCAAARLRIDLDETAEPGRRVVTVFRDGSGSGDTPVSRDSYLVAHRTAAAAASGRGSPSL